MYDTHLWQTTDKRITVSLCSEGCLHVMVGRAIIKMTPEEFFSLQAVVAKAAPGFAEFTRPTARLNRSLRAVIHSEAIYGRPNNQRHTRQNRVNAFKSISAVWRTVVKDNSQMSRDTTRGARVPSAPCLQSSTGQTRGPAATSSVARSRPIRLFRPADWGMTRD